MAITNEQLLAAWKEAVRAHNQASVSAHEYNVLLARTMLEREVPPGFTVDPVDGKTKPAPRG